MTKHVPATPLPYKLAAAGRTLQTVAGWDIAVFPVSHGPITVHDMTANAAYIVHAANAYPQLVAALRNLLAGVCMPTRAVQKAAALLKELGESLGEE